MKRLLVVRLGSLGDLAHTLPAVTAIRHAFPQTTIDWVVERAHEPFLAMVLGLNDIVTLRDRSGGAWIETVRILRSRRYDVAVDFQGLIKSASLARLSGAKRVVGFSRAALRERAAAIFYTERVAADDSGHVIRKNLQLAAALGAASDTIAFPLWIIDSPVQRALAAAGLRDFALINPGAAWPNKRWPPDRFGEVARRLRAEFGLTSLVIWGPHERALADAVVAASDGAATAAPDTGLLDLVALSRAAKLIIVGDTGPMHLAAAVSTPIVGLFGPTSPSRNGPWALDDRVLSRYDACRCHYQRVCAHPESWCLADISVDDVMAAVKARLAHA